MGRQLSDLVVLQDRFNSQYVFTMSAPQWCDVVSESAFQQIECQAFPLLKTTP
jgi:hypothetical protein